MKHCSIYPAAGPEGRTVQAYHRFLPLLTPIIACIVCCLICCSSGDRDYSRNNPFDAGGDNFTLNQPPDSLFVSSGRLSWETFNFHDSTGTLHFHFRATDPNEDYDTLTYTVFLGDTAAIESVYSGRDTVYRITGIGLNDSLYFTVWVSDCFNDTLSTSGLLFSSADIPPAAPAPVTASLGQNSYSITVRWSSVPGADGYRLFRSRHDSFELVLDTSTTSSSVSVSDRGSDYGLTDYYVVAKKQQTTGIPSDTVTGFRYYSSSTSSSSFSASRGTYTDGVRISWYSSSYSSITGYYLFRADSVSSNPFVLIDSFPKAGTSQISFFDSVATYNTYYYILAAYDEANRLFRPSSSQRGYLKKMSLPSSVSATDGTYPTHILVTWSGVSGATGYCVFRSTSSSSNYTKIDSTQATNYRDSVTTSDIFYYRISAFDDKGRETAFSSSYNSGYRKGLDAPAIVNVHSAASPNHIPVSWSPVAGARGYILYRAANITGGTPLSVLDSTETTSLRDSSAGPDTTWYYAVSAFDSLGEGKRSGMEAGTLMPTPAKPTAAIEGNAVKISWDSLLHVRSYTLYRSFYRDSGYTVVYTSSASAHRSCFDSIADIRLLYYRISATAQSGGETPLSNPDTLYRYLGVPQQVGSESNPDSVTLFWSPVPGAEHYIVSRTSLSSPAMTVVDTVHDTTAGYRLNQDERFHYYVRAKTGTSVSRYSDPILGKALRVPCDPRNPTEASNDVRIRLTWRYPDTCSRCEKFYIYRRCGDADTAILLDSTAGTAYEDTLQSPDTCFYRISGVNVLGEGLQCAEFSSTLRKPGFPENITVSNNLYGSHIALTWSAHTEAQGYILYRSTSASGPFLLLDSTTTIVYRDSTTHVDTIYWYRISSYAASGEGPLSDAYSGQLLFPPESVMVQDSFFFLTVSWSAASGAESYRLYRSPDPAGTFSIVDSQLTGTTFFDSVPTAGTYYYRLSSVAHDESALSAVSNGANLREPTTPDGIRASNGTIEDTIAVAWGPAHGAEGYHIYHCTDTSFTSPTLRNSVTDTFLLDTVSSDSLYYYRVKAFNIAGESVLSREYDGGFRQPTAVPGKPDSLNASTGKSDSIELTWHIPRDGSPHNGFRIYRADAIDGTFQVIDSTDSNSYRDDVPKSFPSAYWYKVSAWNIQGEGELSKVAEGYRN